MELVRGQSLTDYATSHGLDLAQRLELFARICDAVHYAHQQGVIHRDLKPANIMVDAAGQPKILDFGVARLTDVDVQATRQTSVGEVIGTLQYMSPEQVNADPVAIDFRSDVYTLGVILYELLTGRPPYDLGRKMIHEAARIILIDDPARISTLNRRLAGDVEIIVAKTLEKEKERRYGSADDLASDVRRFLRDEPILARPASAMYQLQKFARRNRALVGGLALAAVILLLGTAVSVWQAVRATAAERLAESRRGEAVTAGALAERRRALADSALTVADSARAAAQRDQAAATASATRAVGEAAKSTAINEFLQKMLASSDPTNAQGKELSVRELLDQAAAGAGTGDLAHQPEVRAAVETTIGRTYFALGLYDQARPHFDSAYAIRGRSLGHGNLATAESADQLGKLAGATGDYGQAERKLTEALAAMRAALPPNDDRIISALGALADARYSQGAFAHADGLYRKALSLARSRPGPAGLAVAERLGALGGFLSYTGRAPEALPLLQEAVAIARRLYGTTHPRVVDALVALSDAQTFRPDPAAAEAILREALPIARTLYGQAHPTIANIVGRLGTALARQRKLEEAEPLLREALAMRIKLLGDQHPDVQLARIELGRMLMAETRYPEADTLLTEALKARRAGLGDTSPATASSLLDLGLLSLARDDWTGAAARFREAVPIWRAAKIEDQELYSLAELARALQKQGRLDEAEPLLVDVLKRRRALFGDQHWSVGSTYEYLAAVASGRGQPAAAESLTVLGLEIRRAAYGPRSLEVASQLENLAFFVEARNDTSRAISLLRESLGIMTAVRPPTDPRIIGTRRLLAIDLCATGATVEGDSVIRTAIAATPLDSTRALPYRVRSALGFCLTRGRRFVEAEPLLLEAEKRLGALPEKSAATFRNQTVGWLAGLYDQWGKADQAAVWRERIKAQP